MCTVGVIRRNYLGKQETYNFWKRTESHLTWNISVSLRSVMQEVHELAETEYNGGIKETSKCYTGP